MARFCAVQSINAAELARLFHTEIELKFGAPNGNVSDRGPISLVFFICVVSPTSTNRVPSNWPQLLPTAEFATNIAVNSSTFSLSRALIGYDPDLP